MINVTSLAIGCRSFKSWDRRKTKADHVEYQRMRFIHCGKLETQTMRIISQKNGDAYIITATRTIKTTVQAVVDHMAEILELGRSLPIMQKAETKSWSKQYAGNLPDCPQKPHEETTVEKYAERLKADRWDVRRLGEPQEWRLVRV